MRYILFILLSFTFYISVIGQNPLFRKISVDTADFTYTFHISYLEESVIPQNNINYYWYSKGKININEGGFAGQLLVGDYDKTTPDGTLIEKGNFTEGIKSGKWSVWDSSGKLIQITNWKKGKKQGHFWEIDTISNIITRGKYKNDHVNGRYLKSINDSIIEKVRYRKGELIEPIKIKLFRKRDGQLDDLEEETDKQAEQIEDEPATKVIEDEE